MIERVQVAWPAATDLVMHRPIGRFGRPELSRDIAEQYRFPDVDVGYRHSPDLGTSVVSGHLTGLGERLKRFRDPADGHDPSPVLMDYEIPELQRTDRVVWSIERPEVTACSASRVGSAEVAPPNPPGS
jgi:hypothetical protein